MRPISRDREVTPDAGARMVADLLEELRARSRVDPDARPVVLVETPTSWVLLGLEAYKIKKSVEHPFLDFTIAEARESAWREEIRINRRLAPRTYFGVVPVRRRRDGSFTFHADGVITEWALHMNRLDDDVRADRLLARTALDRRHLVDLATTLARFHASAATSPEIARAGAPEAIERNIIDNFAMLASDGAELIDRAALQEIEQWQREFVRTERPRLEGRVRSGAIRDGHGDLRLEHVFTNRRGGFEIIDAIELGDRYRHADVAADIAFLAMDIARLGRVDLAELFVASYAHAADDFDLYPVLDFYESYRACVRATIAVAAATRPGASAASVAAASADARRYLLLAQSAHRRPLLGSRVIAVGGGIGSGKSTLAGELGHALSAPVIDADRTRKSMLGSSPADRIVVGPWKAYDPAFSALVNEEVLRRAGQVLVSGRTVIVDASFRTSASRAAARALASTHGVPLLLLECSAPAAICRQRLRRQREATAVSDASVRVLDPFLASYEPVAELSGEEHTTIDTSGTPEAAVAQAERVVATWPRRLVG